jgi:hypothetical protein
MAGLSPDNPDNTRTHPDLSGDIPTRTDRTNAFRHVRLSGVRPQGRGKGRLREGGNDLVALIRPSCALITAKPTPQDQQRESASAFSRSPAF